MLHCYIAGASVIYIGVCAKERVRRTEILVLINKEICIVM
jgi:hypothetical protein